MILCKYFLKDDFKKNIINIKKIRFHEINFLNYFMI